MMKFMKSVPQGHCLVVERFGKPVSVVKSGLHFFPLFFLNSEKNVSTMWSETHKEGVFIELTEQQTNTGARTCFTKDNVELSVDCFFNWRILDPLKAIYEVDNLHKALIETVLSEVRALIGQKELNFAIGARSQISEHVVSAVEGNLKRWGVKLTSLEIQELKPADEATVAAMRQQMEAARKAEAIKLESEGRAAAIVKQAEAEKTAMALKAEGDEAYLKSLTGVVGYKNAAKILVTIKTLESYKVLTENAANKVFMPLPTLPEVLASENMKTEIVSEKE